MKKGTKEFYDAQASFEQMLRSFPMIRATNLARESGSINGVYYQDGETNSAFICFLQGVAYAKCEYVTPMQSEIDALKAENERLKWALDNLMKQDFRGHSVADRLQFRPLGREILEVYYSFCGVKNV